MLMNKTTTERWNILKYEIESIIGVPERMKIMQITKTHINYRQTLACNTKMSFYAYVRSKQNMQDKRGPPEDSAENIISQVFLMVFNDYCSSMFIREDISSLPVLYANFQEPKCDYLGQLIVTPEMVAKKIKAMKDNNSPGVDGTSKFNDSDL